ncbi:ATPase PAAT isoform X1 [Pseudoliparis swirei]|uniref:ATPase PAAT isoform X1 n=1 Tax=Pseudoliparis swirei TaxID=2059687 RepID=UPI0024BDB7DB|nr:ATPase PAAT isoform X1 [Pseudoliparis swirei]
MVDIAVAGGAAWSCRGRRLSDVLLPVHAAAEEELREPEGDEAAGAGPVLLEQTEDGSPCLLTLRCTSCSPAAAISRLLVVSEARTMEAYDHTGEYCGTVRGERSDGVRPDSSGRGPFYRKQLVLERPSPACDVKLLSLGGRSSVLVRRVVVGLRAPPPAAAHGPGIDMQQVQCLVEQMGASLSPGARSLMEMVHFQQKNQTGSLGGFLPLLMGGGILSALAQGANVSAQPQPAASRSGATSDASSSSSSSSSDLLASGVNTEIIAGSGGPAGGAQLAELISRLLSGGGPAAASGPELLPVLQSLCGQVTKLRLDDAEEEEMKKRNGSWELDPAMERRLEEMERRLTEHVDRRLDALEQKLEKTLLAALERAAPSGAACPGPFEQSAPTAATH